MLLLIKWYAFFRSTVLNLSVQGLDSFFAAMTEKQGQGLVGTKSGVDGVIEVLKAKLAPNLLWTCRITHHPGNATQAPNKKIIVSNIEHNTEDNTIIL